MLYLTSIAGTPRIASLSDSAAAGKVALIPSAVAGSAAADGAIVLLDQIYLKTAARFTLPTFTVGSAAFAAHGRWVFFDHAGNSLYALVEADPASGLVNDFAVVRILLATQGSCGAAFASATASVVAAGSLGAINITASPDCIWQASSDSSWLAIVSGGNGGGNGTLSYIARPYFGSGPRTGKLSIGGQLFTVTQDAHPLRVPQPPVL